MNYIKFIINKIIIDFDKIKKASVHETKEQLVDGFATGEKAFL